MFSARSAPRRVRVHRIATGIREGARTGLAAAVTACCSRQRCFPAAGQAAPGDEIRLFPALMAVGLLMVGESAGSISKT